MKYDIIIVGAGPSGITAAIYALRADKKVIIFEKEVIGGKIASSSLIENYPGIKEMKGPELSDQFREQVLALGGEIQGKEVIEIVIEDNKKQVKTKNEVYEAKAIILAMGTKYRTLALEKEKFFLGKGISFCATCDGFFYKNKIVAVIGGGNTAIANALELANICKKVYLIQLLDHLTGESILEKRLKENSKIEVLYNTSVEKWIGEEKITGIEIKQRSTTKTLPIDGAFLSIGQIPETDLVKEIVLVNEKGYIQIDENYQTSKKGIFAGGDCVNKKIRQLTTAVNDGTIASLNAIAYIENLKEEGVLK